jgi:hypothetical protein
MTAQSVLLLGLAIAVMALFLMLVTAVATRIKKERPRDHLTIQDVLKAAAAADDDEAGP